MKVKSKNIHIIASIATVRKLRDTFEPDCSPRGGGGRAEYRGGLLLGEQVRHHDREHDSGQLCTQRPPRIVPRTAFWLQPHEMHVKLLDRLRPQAKHGPTFLMLSSACSAMETLVRAPASSSLRLGSLFHLLKEITVQLVPPCWTPPSTRQ